MSNILITGTSGLIAGALAQSLAKSHNVVCMSRREHETDLPFVKGDFASDDDLSKLDDYPIDIVIHLAAVTGGCKERDGVMVNCEGTRTLMQYCIARGARKFVLASSIALVGMQSIKFRPLEMPIPDDHPCLDRDGYGMSKYLMEEISKYLHRQYPDIDVLNLRLASVPAPDDMPPKAEPREIHQWTLGAITVLSLEDSIRAFTLAADKAQSPGVRTMNICPRRAWVAVPIVEILGPWYGDDVDLSYYGQPGHEYDSAFMTDLAKEYLGFEA